MLHLLPPLRWVHRLEAVRRLGGPATVEFVETIPDNSSASPPRPGPHPHPARSRDVALELLAKMYEIRFFEDDVRGLFEKNLVRGSTHLCQGQEAIPVGVAHALRAGDTMTCTYRGHGAVLAMGAPLDASFGEILGRAEGLCGGKGGSMHLADFAVGALGSNAIVGAHLPITVGAALAAQYLKTGAVSVCFFGDGATNIGTFHESLNLAAIWKLPALFVIENNQYGEYSPLATTTPIERLADRASSYGIPGIHIDGNDVFEVADATAAAVERARGGEGPTLIEAVTYRQQGHSRSDPASYRPAGEFDHWLQRDPIRLLRQRIEDEGFADISLMNSVESEARSVVAEALQRALSWPTPELAAGLRDVYA